MASKLIVGILLLAFGAGMPKRARVRLKAADLLATPRLTVAHVQTVLRALPDELNVDSSARHEMERAAREIEDQVGHVMKLQLLNGGHYQWFWARLDMLWRMLVGASPCLQRLLEKKPCSHNQPWRMVLYLDGITPGNIAAPTNYRTFVGRRLFSRSVAPERYFSTL